MRNSRLRRPFIIRLPRNDLSRRRVRIVGACAACGATFGGSPGQETGVAEVLRVHQALCPGGRRAGQLVRPFR